MRRRRADDPKDGDRESVRFGAERLTFTFDEKAARRAVDFFPRYLVHIEGPRGIVGTPFKLAPWEHGLLWRVFGWKRADGSRRYRSAYVEIGRKNGKSNLGAGIALLLLTADNEPAAQIYGAADNREQAKIIWRIAAQMVLRNPELRSILDVLESTKTICFKDPIAHGPGFYRAIPADAPSAHGINAHGVIVDELHTQPNRDLVDVLTSSQGARTQPLTFFFTTAGFDRKSICGEEHDRAVALIDGKSADPYHYAVVYAAAPGDDIQDPKTWQKANPGWDYMGEQFRDDLRAAARKAAMVPAYENTFKRLRLDIWTTQNVRWMPMEAWDRCGGIVVPSELEGRRCYAGLDLSSTTDLTAFAAIFPPDDEETGVYRVLVWYWVPEEGIRRRSALDHVPYEQWAADAYIKATPGVAVDMRIVKADILALSKRFNIREIAFDRWGATQIANELNEEGLEVIPFGQGYRDLTGPTKALLEHVLGGRIDHGGNPVLRWNADNLVVTQDPAGNIKPDKAKSTERVDGAVALIMALGRAVANRGSVAPSIRWMA